MFSAPETDPGGTFPALLRHHPQRHRGEACESAAKATRVEDGHLSRHQSSAMGSHGQPWATAVLELGMADRWKSWDFHGTSHGKNMEIWDFSYISGGSMDWYKGLKLQETLGPPKSPNPEWIFRDLGSYLGVQCEVMGISIVITSISWDITPISLWPYAHGFYIYIYCICIILYIYICICLHIHLLPQLLPQVMLVLFVFARCHDNWDTSWD